MRIYQGTESVGFTDGIPVYTEPMSISTSLDKVKAELSDLFDTDPETIPVYDGTNNPDPDNYTGPCIFVYDIN